MNQQNDKRAPEIITPTVGDISFPEPVKLKGGIPVYLMDGGAIDILRIELIFPAGQVMDEVHLTASMVSAMLTEGTLKHNAITLNNLIDSTGAVLKGSAGKDRSSLVVVTLPRMLDDVMRLTGEILLQPAFHEKEFRRLTERRIQSFLTQRQKTAVIARELFYESLCGKENPYGRITTEQDYRELTTDDLHRFHLKHYKPCNIYITVAGKDPEQALPVLEKYFDSRITGTSCQPSLPGIKFESSPPGTLFHEMPGSVQSSIRLGWKGLLRNDPDFWPLQVATVLLGGYFGSRLMRKIREEKGYTYGIQAVSGAFQLIGFITIMSDVANTYRDEALADIRNEIKELQSVLVSEEELSLVRNQMMGELARLFDGPFSRAEVIKSVIDYGTGSDYYNRFAESVKSITPARVRELFNTYFSLDQAQEITAGAG